MMDDRECDHCLVTTLRKQVGELEGVTWTRQDELDRLCRALEPAKDLLTLVRATCNPPKDLDDMIAFMQKKITTAINAHTSEKERREHENQIRS
jgi:hypothetical protein